jgi:hypothetical protein
MAMLDERMTWHIYVSINRESGTSQQETEHWTSINRSEIGWRLQNKIFSVPMVEMARIQTWG